VIGTVAGLRAVKNLSRLVEAVASLDRPARLVIVGDGPERPAILAAAERCGIGDRLVMPGFLKAPARYIGLFDIFALSSDSEQAPIALIEAMAAGLPVVAPRIGDIPAMLSIDNAALLSAPGDTGALGVALARLAADPALRDRLGAANRKRAEADYGEDAMLRRYMALYGRAMRRIDIGEWAG